MLVKILGSVLVISCGVVFGMSERAKFSHKVSVIKGIINAIDFIHSEMSCMCTPTEELLDKLCKFSGKILRVFFDECKNNHQKRKDLPFGLIWGRCVKDASYLGLDQDEENALIELGNALGRYEVEEQLLVLANARKYFEIYLESARENQRKLGKLYGNLSLISGVALVILLI